jgi:hypothetical protein
MYFVCVCVCASKIFCRGGGPMKKLKKKRKTQTMGYVSGNEHLSLCLCFVRLCDQNAPNVSQRQLQCR